MVNPFISIIIPVKNFARTIEKAFEYLLNVDYPWDCWEWVIADGGLTDKTIEIIKNWQKRYPFIKLVAIHNLCRDGSQDQSKSVPKKGNFKIIFRTVPKRGEVI